MLWLPDVNAEVVKLAAPPASVTGVPRMAAPSLNWTVPVGDAPVTVALKVTAWPGTLGLSEEVTAVVDVLTLTCCVVVVELGLKLACHYRLRSR